MSWRRNGWEEWGRLGKWVISGVCEVYGREEERKSAGEVQGGGWIFMGCAKTRLDETIQTVTGRVIGVK